MTFTCGVCESDDENGGDFLFDAPPSCQQSVKNNSKKNILQTVPL